MSHIQQQRELFARNKATVIQLLNWNTSDYHVHQYEQGINYLDKNFPDSFDMEILEPSPIFWKWWINQWNLRDASYLPIIKQKQVILTMADYRHLHSSTLINTHPSSLIMEESFAIMIDELNKDYAKL